MSGALLLALDTATRRAVIALGDGVSAPRAARSWEVGYHHSAELLTTLDELLKEAGGTLRDIEAVVAGTGPGSFTGLRVGLATAKALAYGLHRPIVGVPSTAALALAAFRAADAQTNGIAVAVALPAGPSDRYLARYRLAAHGSRDETLPTALEAPRLIAGREPLEALLDGCSLAAVDVANADLPGAALRLGAAAQEGLGAALLSLGRRALAAGAAADLAELVPEYVTLPRGITEQHGEISWSRDLR